MKKIWIIHTIFALLVTLPIFAGNAYYVDGTNGNDLNGGTSLETAWKTIAKANSELQAGDIVYIVGGTYKETIAPSNSGTSGNYITYKNYNSKEVIISNVGHGIYLNNISYIIIDGLKIIDVGRFVVIKNDSKHNIIRNCYMENASEWGGIRIENSSYNKILNNYIYNGHGDLVELYPNADYNLIEGNEISGGPLNTHSCLLIRSTNDQNPSSYNIVRDNYIHGGHDDNVNILQKVDHNLIEDNIIENTPGAGLKFCGGQYNIFRRNIVIDCKSYGFGIYTNLYGEYQSFGTNNKFYKNVAYRSNRGKDMDAGCRLLVYEGGSDIKNNCFKNNIFLENNPSQIYINADPGYKDNVYANIFSNNVLFSGDIGGYLVKYKGIKYSLSEIESLQGSGFSNNIDADPNFVSTSNKNFHLKANSPCINAGAFLTETTASGSGTQITVDDAGYFTDGYGLIEGDIIQLEGQTLTARIIHINYNNNVITVNKSLNWYSSQGVSLVYNGSAPDIGPYEYQGSTSPLSAEINALPTSGHAPLSVNFTGNASGGNSPYTYSWDFGDGSTSSSQNPSHTFNSAETYTVTFTVTDSASSTATDSLTITATSPPTPLSASVSASTTSGEAPLTVNFTGSASGGKSPYSYSWDFGDGSTSSSQNPSHTFSSAGTYTVTLTVTDSTSSTATDSLTITATSPPAAEANLSISSLTGSPAPGSGGTTDPSPGNHSYAVGSSVQVKAEAKTDYRFAKWSGDVNSSDLYVPQITITLDKDKSVSAHFYTKCGDVNGDLSITPADAQAAFDIFLGKIRPSLRSF